MMMIMVSRVYKQEQLNSSSFVATVILINDEFELLSTKSQLAICRKRVVYYDNSVHPTASVSSILSQYCLRVKNINKKFSFERKHTKNPTNNA